VRSVDADWSANAGVAAPRVARTNRTVLRIIHLH
jgi:hypothetical protein